MKFKSFEEIIGWQKGKMLFILIYKIFKNSKDYGFKDQIYRASLSISNNIAEGFERNSNKDFKRFLNISQGSNSEVKSMLIIAKELDMLSIDEFENCIGLTNEIGKVLNGLIKSIE